jgi:hypothetical protein
MQINQMHCLNFKLCSIWWKHIQLTSNSLSNSWFWFEKIRTHGTRDLIETLTLI